MNPAKSQWLDSVLLQDQETSFKLDTGAEFTAITEEALKQIPNEKLTKTSQVLQGPTGQSLKVLSQFAGTLCRQDKTCKQNIFVVRGLCTNLLRLPAITALHLTTCLETMIKSTTWDSREKYPKLFHGLGTL